jgi:hypothetical protein
MDSWRRCPSAAAEPSFASSTINEKNAKEYGKSKAVTEYKLYPGRSHYTMIQDGWEQVADYALTWAVEHSTSEPVAQGAPERAGVASGSGA